ncbi:MAG: efflux RND transporter periplasmic adaptor subunit [Planctomycetota bacterium]|nr:efflux RND transporter periplasmic adaptor subunit [Planctomycetota bacterium]
MNQPARASLMGNLWLFIRVVNVRLRFVLLMVIVGLVAAKWETIVNTVDRWQHPVTPISIPATAPGEHVHAEGEIEYFCPMHPNVRQAEPGNCPICGMPLVKRVKQAERVLPEGVLAEVELTPLKVRMGRIGTSPVEYRLLTREVRAVGSIDYDQTRRALITARVKGRIDKLLVNYVGQRVSRGDPLAQVYSPDLLVAQEELLSAVRAARELKSADAGIVQAGAAVVDAARKKLALWGVTPEQVEAVIKRGTPETHMTIVAPMAGIVTEKRVLEGNYIAEGETLYTVADLGRVWLQAQVYEGDIQGLEEGAAVEVTSTAYPQDRFAGRITFVAFNLDPATRTLAARVEIDNPQYKLKPGMFAEAVMRLPLGKVTVLPEAATQPATMPVSASVSASTDDVASAYLALAKAYADDKIDAVAAKRLAEAAAKIADGLPSAAALRDAARALEGKNIEAQRKTFQAITAAAMELFSLAPPAKAKLLVAHCPMVKADWLTDSREIRNPYAGAEMLTCGSITGPLEPARSADPRDDGRYVTGYFCPVTPDRLYESPAECPADGAAFKRVRMEKSLALPESAVIDTGTRKIVYRESRPGLFDMVEVKLSPPAGGFFAVLDGLAPGDRVATRGAFLVDAENRLNPAAH